MEKSENNGDQMLARLCKGILIVILALSLIIEIALDDRSIMNHIFAVILLLFIEGVIRDYIAARKRRAEQIAMHERIMAKRAREAEKRAKAAADRARNELEVQKNRANVAKAADNELRQRAAGRDQK